MGDDQHRALLHQSLDGLLHQPLRFGVERAGGLVQDEDRWIAQQRAGDRDPLALAARETGPPLAQHGVVALRQRGDEAGSVGRLGGGLDLIAGVAPREP